MSNNMKAALYVLVGIIVGLAAMATGVFMYFSATFIPVYVGSTYVIGNQLLRYLLYGVLFTILVASIKLTEYGVKYISKKIKKALH